MDEEKRLPRVRGLDGLPVIAGHAGSSRSSAGSGMPFMSEITAIPIASGADAFPARRLDCIGRSLEAHARAMCSDPPREPPFLRRPTDAVQVVLPGRTVDHHCPTLMKNGIPGRPDGRAHRRSAGRRGPRSGLTRRQT